MKRAMITGITGQDGSYLAQHLVDQDYEVWGFVHGKLNEHVGKIRRLLNDEIHLVYGDLLHADSVLSAIDKVRPEEVYNLAAVTHVPTSWEHAELAAEVTGLGALRVLEAIRLHSGISDSRTPTDGQIRFWQASSSEMYGDSREYPQNELTPFQPVTPYGTAKMYAHMLTQNYRESYGMYAMSGIMFNHESPRRSPEFLSRKVSLGVARIKLGQDRKLRLGLLTSRRDWGFAGDYVRAMPLMLAQNEPKDYVIGTGVTHSVEEFVSRAFLVAGLDWHKYVVTDTAYIRPTEAHELCADPSKAAKELGWTPAVSFDQLVEMMVESDIRSSAVDNA